MTDTNFFFGGGSAFEEWLRKIIEDSLQKFHSEQKFSYHSLEGDSMRVLTRNQVAERLGVSVNTVTKYIKHRKLKARNDFGVYSITEYDLFNFIHQNRHGKN